MEFTPGSSQPATTALRAREREKQYGLSAKAPTLRDLMATKRLATAERSAITMTPKAVAQIERLRRNRTHVHSKRSTEKVIAA